MTEDQVAAADAPVGGETRGTVILALAANLAVALAKVIGGALTGSAALLSEAAHSVADTLNEVFLLFSLGSAERPPDRSHPFGYGAERFFWSLLAAVGIFVSGAGFSLYEGITSLTGSAKTSSSAEFLAIYAVLAVSAVFEGSSLLKASRQIRGEASRARRSVRDYVRRSPDPTVKTVASEDSVAVVGLVVAAAGTIAHQITGRAGYEGVASLVIAALLAYVAYALGRDTKDLLINQAADPAIRVIAFNVISSYPEVVAISQLLTMQLGPNQILLASRLQFGDELMGRDIERVSTEIERELARRVPSLREVFLDPSRVSASDLERVSANIALSLEEVRDLDGDAAAERMRSRMGRRLRTPAG